MKNIKQIISKGLIVGGPLTTGGSIYDSSQNKALNDENDAQLRVRGEVMDVHGIVFECATVPGGNGVGAVRAYFVGGDHTEEEKEKIMADYHAELQERYSDIPSDPEAHERGRKDAVGTFGGIGIALAGGLLGMRKEREG